MSNLAWKKTAHLEVQGGKKKKKKKKEKTKNTPEYFSVITEKLDCVLPEVKLIFRRIFGGLHSMFSG